MGRRVRDVVDVFSTKLDDVAKPSESVILHRDPPYCSPENNRRPQSISSMLSLVEVGIHLVQNFFSNWQFGSTSLWMFITKPTKQSGYCFMSCRRRQHTNPMLISNGSTQHNNLGIGLVPHHHEG